MKKATLPVLCLAIAAVAFLAGTRFRPAIGAGGRKVLYYVDPMHPAYRSDKPGIAPDCGMQLEPVYEDGAAPTSGPPRPAGAVNVALDRRQLLGVRVGAVEKRPTTHVTRLLGKVALDERRVYVLNAATEGSVRSVSGVTTGSRVKKGQWLASVFSPEARMPLQAFITSLDVQDRDEESRKRTGNIVAAGGTPSSSAQFAIERLRGVGVSEGQIEEMRRTRQVPLTVEVQSPADGFVLARNVSPGQKYDKGAEWFRVGDLEKVWILVDATADEAAHLRPGMTAQLALAGGHARLPARVSDVLPQFDAATRTMKVRLEADNPGYALRPDMFVDVELPIELPAATTIPVDAMIDAGTRKTVFVERADGWFEPRAVETGWRFGDRVEVVSGLSPGERIVLSGTFLVDSESRLRSAAAGVYGVPAKDPVCGMDVDEAKAKAAGKHATHGGKTYYFCSDGCRESFTKAPAQFVAGPGAPGPAAAGHEHHAPDAAR